MSFYKIGLLPKARKDIKRISKFMKNYNYDKTINKIYENINNLQYMPRIHKTLIYFKDKDAEYRRIVSGKYVAIYKIVENEIIILRIFNQRENYLSQRKFILREKSQKYSLIK